MIGNAGRQGLPARTARRLGVVLLVAGLAAGCGGQDGSGSSATPTETTAPSTSAPADSRSSTTPSPTTTTPTTTSPTTTSPATLPGEAFSWFAQNGDVLAVMGVAHDDVLSVRAMPGTDAPVVAELAPTRDDVVATGRARRLTRTIWSEVRVGSVTGWANISYLGFAGSTDDATAEFLRGAAPPRSSTLQGLGALVAKRFAPADPEPGLRIVQSAPASVGDLGEITYDVIGIADDSIAGYRLHVFATPDSGGFVLRTIERTQFCWRGISGGLCV